MSDPVINPPIYDYLPPGSTQTTLTGLLPNTQYTVFIYHLSPGPHKSGSPVLTLTFTTAANQATALVPTSPSAFVGKVDASGLYKRDGSYGLIVTPAEFPSTLVMEVATETAIGSGTPGAYATATSETARVSTAGIVNLTQLTTFAANDQLQRWARCYATRDGMLASAYTTPVAISPWGPPIGARLVIAGVLVGPQ